MKTITIIKDGQKFELNYYKLKRLVDDMYLEAWKDMVDAIKNSENGMTTSDLKKTFGMTGAQVASALWGAKYGCHGLQVEKNVKKEHHFVEVDDNNVPIEGSDHFITTKETRYYSK